MHLHREEPYSSGFAKEAEAQVQEETKGVNIFLVCHDVPRMAGSPTVISHQIALELDYLREQQESEQADDPTIYKYNKSFYYIYLEENQVWAKFAKRDGDQWHLVYSFWVKRFPTEIFSSVITNLKLRRTRHLFESIHSVAYDFWNGSQCKEQKPSWVGNVHQRRGNRATRRRAPRGRNNRGFRRTCK